MRKKVYFLASCSTCQRIMKDVGVDDSFEQQNIKADKITAAQLDEMKAMAGTYEDLFSRKAMKYRAMGLHESSLNETDYRQLILDEYTFLKRPVFILDDAIFVGNSKKTVEAIKQKLIK